MALDRLAVGCAVAFELVRVDQALDLGDKDVVDRLVTCENTNRQDTLYIEG